MRAGEAEQGIPKTLSELIYRHLKDSIINGELRANEKINEKEIARAFQVSVTPVREALLRLGAEGFVTISSHREATVRAHSFKDLREIFEVLSILDSSAAGAYVDYLPSTEIRELEALTESMIEYGRAGDLKNYINLNNTIHHRLWKRLPNQFLTETLSRVHMQLLRYTKARYHAFQKNGVLERSMEEHRGILAALKTRDEKKLRALLAKHWGSLLQPSPFEEGLKEYIQTKGGELREKRTENKLKREGLIPSALPAMKGEKKRRMNEQKNA